LSAHNSYSGGWTSSLVSPQKASSSGFGGFQ